MAYPAPLHFRIHTVLLLISGLLAGIAVLAASSPDNSWRAKVDPELLGIGTAPEEFMVVFQEQADLPDATRPMYRQERLETAFERLRETAARCQAPLQKELKARGIEFQSFWLVNMIRVRGDAGLVETMARRADVALVESDRPVRMGIPAPPGPEGGKAAAPAGIEWNVTKIRAPEAWDLGALGQGVVVAGADTGYTWDHPAIKNQYRGWNGAAADHNHNWHDAIHDPGSSCGTDIQAPCDDYGHGTHTMGTMVGDDGGTNQIGVAPEARWIGCRNMSGGWGTPSRYIECLQWFIAPTDLAGQNPDPALAPQVIDNSYACVQEEGCTDPAALLLAVQNVRAAGIFMAVSAGNEGSGCGSVGDPPAIYAESFSVGATDSNDTIAGFSSRGPVTRDGSNRMKPDASAPGVGVRSCVPGGGYAVLSGTSMAAPHVAGLVALIISANPDTAGDVDWIEALIRQTAVGLTSAQGCGGIPADQIPNDVYGYGRIDALAAVVRARQDMDRNGLLTGEDVNLLAAVLAGNLAGPAAGVHRGDVNGDGVRDAADLVRLRLAADN
jgi:serine protease AprX